MGEARRNEDYIMMTQGLSREAARVVRRRIAAANRPKKCKICRSSGVSEVLGALGVSASMMTQATVAMAAAMAMRNAGKVSYRRRKHTGRRSSK